MRNYMQDIWAINIVVPTTDSTDRYDRVSINEAPIICFGRETQVTDYVNGDSWKGFIRSKFDNKELWDQAIYKIRHMWRDEGFWDSRELEWKASEHTDISFDN